MKTQLANETETATEDKTSEGGKLIEGEEKTSIYNIESGGFATADANASPYGGAGSPAGGEARYSKTPTNNPYSNSEVGTSKYSKPPMVSRVLGASDFGKYSNSSSKVTDNTLEIAGFYNYVTSKNATAQTVLIEVTDPDNSSVGTIFSTQATYTKTDNSANAGKFVQRYSAPRRLQLPMEWMGKRLRIRYYKDTVKSSNRIYALDDTIPVPNTPGDLAIRQEAVTYLKSLKNAHADMKKHYVALLANSGNTYFDDIKAVVSHNDNVAAAGIPQLKSDLQKNTATKAILTQLENKYNTDFNPDIFWNKMSQATRDAITNQDKVKLSLTYHWLWIDSQTKTQDFGKAGDMKDIYQGNNTFYSPTANYNNDRSIDVAGNIAALSNKEQAIQNRFGQIEAKSKTDVAKVRADRAKSSVLKKGFMDIIVKIYESRTQNLVNPKKGAANDAITNLDNIIREKGVGLTPLEILKGITPTEIGKIQGLIVDAQKQYDADFQGIRDLFADKEIKGKGNMTKPGGHGYKTFSIPGNTYYMRFGPMKETNNFAFSPEERNMASTISSEYNSFAQIKKVFDNIIISGTGPGQTITIKDYNPTSDKKSMPNSVKYDHRDLSVVKKPLAAGDVAETNIEQMGLGDCWLLGSTACIAEQDPKKILGGQNAAIKQVGDKFEVQLWTNVATGGGKSTLKLVTVMVSPTFLAETKISNLQETSSEYIYTQNKFDNSGRFMQVIEKAFAQLYGGYEEIDGGTPREAWEHLLGEDSKVYTLGNLAAVKKAGKGVATIDEAIKYINAYKAATGRMPLVAVATPKFPPTSSAPGIARPASGEDAKFLPKVTVGNQTLNRRVLYGKHAYAVSGISSNGVFELRNPHNKSASVFAGTGDETLQLTKAELDKEFANMTIFDSDTQDKFNQGGKILPTGKI